MILGHTRIFESQAAEFNEKVQLLADQNTLVLMPGKMIFNQ